MLLFPVAHMTRCAPATTMSITKKSKSLLELNPATIPVGCSVNPKKIADVKNLLSKHFGENWQERECLQWYRNLTGLSEGGNSANSEPCECNELESEDFDELDLSNLKYLHGQSAE